MRKLLEITIIMCISLCLIISPTAFLFSQTPCTSGNYATAPVVPANAYPYTSPGSGITVNATLGGGIGTLNNFQYACNGTPYNCANPAWWLNNASQSITLTFSQSVCSFSVIVNGTGNTEEFYFSSVGSLNNNCLGVSGLCTNGWTVLPNGSGMAYNGGGASSNLLVVNNPSGATTYVLTHNGLAAGSRYALVDCFQSCPMGPTCTLPIEMLSFSGEGFNEYNQLKWVTSSEVNNDYFVVEASSTGMNNFTPIGELKGAGNSSTEKSYNFSDFNPSRGITYYRVRQVDFDKKYSVSDVIAVKSNQSGNVSIYPNPSSGNLNIDVDSKSNEQLRILYINVIGVVSEEVIFIQNGNNTVHLQQFNQLKSGIYFIKVLDELNNVLYNQKVVKQ